MAQPVVVPHNLDAQALSAMLDRLDGVLLSGGGDIDPVLFGEEEHSATCEIEPERDSLELTLARWFVERNIPCHVQLISHRRLRFRHWRLERVARDRPAIAA